MKKFERALHGLWALVTFFAAIILTFSATHASDTLRLDKDFVAFRTLLATQLYNPEVSMLYELPSMDSTPIIAIDRIPRRISADTCYKPDQSKSVTASTKVVQQAQHQHTEATEGDACAFLNYPCSKGESRPPTYYGYDCQLCTLGTHCCSFQAVTFHCLIEGGKPGHVNTAHLFNKTCSNNLCVDP